MKHGSLFSGIGGFDLAAQWMGWENIFHCEINEFGKKVLNYYWPKSISYDDIKKTDFTIHRGAIDVLSGGFPCQPYSQAGKRLGKEDERHLWPEMLRAVREIQPSYVVSENVRGLTNWNGGMVFDEVQAGLEAEGYEVLPFLLPACAVNAPHRRDRIWFIAHSIDNRHKAERSKEKETDGIQSEIRAAMGTRKPDGTDIRQTITNDNIGSGQEHELSTGRNLSKERIKGSRNVTNNHSNKRSERRMYTKGQNKTERHLSSCDTWEDGGNWQNFPTQPPICSGDDGIPRELDGITFPKWRNESIKGFGNAIVPQVVFQIFKAIQLINQSSLNRSK